MAKLREIILYASDIVVRSVRNSCPFLWTHCFDFFTLALVDVVRLAPGHRRAPGVENSKRPEKPLEVYEFEGCPYCRKVRETLSVLDIDHIVYPCPKETITAIGVCLNSRFRPVVKAAGGAARFPYLVDPNTNVKMYQSDDINKYLWKTYGDKASPPWNYRLAFWPPFRDLSLTLAQFCRPCLDLGLLRAPARNPEKTLELWGHESSPYVRPVKEALCTLEIPYLFHVMPFGSEEKRKAFAKDHADSIPAWRLSAGMVRIPFLKDPNTKKELFESSDIVAYLRNEYQTAPVPAETWMDMAKY